MSISNTIITLLYHYSPSFPHTQESSHHSTTITSRQPITDLTPNTSINDTQSSEVYTHCFFVHP